MENLRKFFSKKFHILIFEKVNNAVLEFSIAQKVVFYTVAGIFTISSFILLSKVNNAFLVEVPAEGGTLVEGIVGTPRFVNPVLAISDADKDLVALVYSGLLKATPDGKLIPDLAKNYTISSDGRTYSFTLKENIYFHDGTEVTADDIIFTIERAQDPSIKSPKRANWDGVFVEKVGEKEVRFSLKQPYSSFLENATLGILPKHIWKSADSDQLFTFSAYNIEPVGSGPYKVKAVKYDSLRIPVFYDLVPFSQYALGKPFVAHIEIKTFQNETAAVKSFEGGYVETINRISPETAVRLKAGGAWIETSPLPRVFGIFFNQNQAPIFANKEVRAALDIALDKQKIVDEVLKGYGTVLDGPIPEGFLPVPGEVKNVSASTTFDRTIDNTERAKKILIDNGWKMSTTTGLMSKKTKKETVPLQFTISTSDVPELEMAAEIVKKAWEKIGAEVTVRPFETSDLNQNVIRPRKYDSLLFGEIVGRDLDFFPFWHSSQRNDPGLNIALYASITTDKLLQEARVTTDMATRLEKYKKFGDEINKDKPAIFLYSPNFVYLVPKKIKNLSLGKITTPADRFLGVHLWYIETDRVWKIFLRNNG